jgi:hypothetical protein
LVVCPSGGFVVGGAGLEAAVQDGRRPFVRPTPIPLRERSSLLGRIDRAGRIARFTTKAVSFAAVFYLAFAISLIPVLA